MTGAYTGITSVGTLGSLTVTGDLTVDTNTLKVDSTNNRVGINITSPTANLDVVGNQVIRAAATQDGIQLAGRAGGTTSLTTKLIPTTLTANRTLTLPDVDGTAITTGNLSDITAVGTLASGSIPATLLTGTIASARISGSYTGITGVGTLASGSIPASLLTGTTLPATIVTSSLTTVGTITSGTWSGSFGAVSGANLTSLNASNISSGTLANARLPATATTITSVGTLTGLTTTGEVIMNRGALGTVSGNSITFLNPNATTTNGDTLDTRLIRNSNGSDWTTAVWRMGRLVDTTRMGFIQFGDGAGSQDARLGVGSTTYATVNTSGLTIVGNVVATGDLQITTASKNLIALNPTTGTGNAAQWLLVFGNYILIRNTSTRNDKENIQPLNDIVTPSMIDDIDISLWNRKGATGFPEIGPMAEDMDDISPFLSIRGMDCDDEGNIVPTEPGGINQNSWLSLLTLGIQDIRQRLQQLENT
jgi:hypothetical protein